MMILTLNIPGKPVAKARPRFARRGNFVTAYKPKKEEYAEARFCANAKEQLRLLGLYEPIPKGTAVRLSCLYKFETPKSWAKKRRAEAVGTPHTQKPDLDNLVKFTKDALNGLAWADDSQVSSYGECSKRWDSESCTVIRIEVLEETE